MLLTWKIIEMEVLKHCGLIQKTEISKVLISYFKNILKNIAIGEQNKKIFIIKV